jgi:hypothetical protein
MPSRSSTRRAVARLSAGQRSGGRWLEEVLAERTNLAAAGYRLYVFYP